jgi:molybdate transport system substrate-binding protein
MPSRCFSLIAALCCLVLLSCGQSPKTPPATAARLSVLFSVAASTNDIAETLAAKFGEGAQVEIKINPGPSSGLANQIIEGAPADLFLSANKQWADKVVAAGLAESSRPLLTNKLVIVVPKGNPAGVKTPQDLASKKVQKLALAGEKVPAGMYADQALGKLALLEPLQEKIVRGQDVRTALAYVERGEAEAGIVYATDAIHSQEVEMVHKFDPALHDEVVYMLVVLKHGAKNPHAQRFYDFLLSDDADVVYVGAGFERLQQK